MTKDNLSGKVTTQICLEIPDKTNPFICAEQFLAGYNTLSLATSSTFVDVLLLLFNLELPSEADRHLLETLMIGLINPGPRHPATKAAMASGLSKTNAEHILPIAASTIGGERGGAKEVFYAHHFIKNHLDEDVQNLVCTRLHDSAERFAPGFGTHYGNRDSYIESLSLTIQKHCKTGKHFDWVMALTSCLHEQNSGLLDVGLAAAIFCDLGIKDRESIGLYQFIRLPGMLAHGLEQTRRPVSDVPLLEDENYVYTP
ncbi:hypothetical protein [Alteromonas sp. a30]|uniref:hypothetical protein n=1 Tax=Alteromonas sp. a30 TaxID=2730917 RepID=UPI002281E722|nr:hypothetical protein [Alteromonas sp. a30]MCY7294160.1 hypothetical protein [Alteromonas sp. a30]